MPGWLYIHFYIEYALIQEKDGNDDGYVTFTCRWIGGSRKKRDLFTWRIYSVENAGTLNIRGRAFAF